MGFGLLSQILIILFSFITRTIFIKNLSTDYLGLNGLFSDILILLSLTELGFGTAIIYSMYKPMAIKDSKKLTLLLKLYKKIYNFFGIIIVILGVLISPFLNFFISDIPNIPNITFIFLLYVLNSAFSYFMGYKKSILITDQKIYIFSIIQFIVLFFQNLIQIYVLITTKNYILYLIIMTVSTFLINLITSIYVDKKYPYIKEKTNEKLSKEELYTIKKNVKNMFVSKVSSTIVTSTDNILISKFVSTSLLGLYSNYMIFVNLIKQVISKIFESVTGSIGNLVSIESIEKSFMTYQRVSLINYWISGLSCFLLFFVANKFIIFWIGDNFVLSNNIILIIAINLYFRLIRNVSLVFIDTYGLFEEIKIKCIVESILNIIFSLIFVKIKLGIFGILLGTFFSNILTNFWYEPYILFKLKFKTNILVYFDEFIKNIINIIISYICCMCIFKILNVHNAIVDIIITIIICFIVYNIFFILVFYKTDNFKYWKKLILRRRN